MYSLLYVSSATTLFSKEELLALLKLARERNAAADITGMLLYKDGNFMQLLEGEEAGVKALYVKISGDRRHKGTVILLAGSIAKRSFPDWSMGFRDLRSPELLDVPGFADFMNTPLSQEEFIGDPDRAQRLLLTFKRIM